MNDTRTAQIKRQILMCVFIMGILIIGAIYNIGEWILLLGGGDMKICDIVGLYEGLMALFTLFIFIGIYLISIKIKNLMKAVESSSEIKKRENGFMRIYYGLGVYSIIFSLLVFFLLQFNFIVSDLFKYELATVMFIIITAGIGPLIISFINFLFFIIMLGVFIRIISLSVILGRKYSWEDRVMNKRR